MVRVALFVLNLPLPRFANLARVARVLFAGRGLEAIAFRRCLLEASSFFARFLVVLDGTLALPGATS